MYERQLGRSGSTVASIWLWHLPVLSYLSTMSSETFILAFSGILFRGIALCALHFLDVQPPDSRTCNKRKMQNVSKIRIKLWNCPVVCACWQQSVWWKCAGSSYYFGSYSLGSVTPREIVFQDFNPFNFPALLFLERSSLCVPVGHSPNDLGW